MLAKQPASTSKIALATRPKETRETWGTSTFTFTFARRPDGKVRGKGRGLLPRHEPLELELRAALLAGSIDLLPPGVACCAHEDLAASGALEHDEPA